MKSRLETASFVTNDGIELPFHSYGSGDTTIIITNAPGMSVKFWLPLIGEIQKPARILMLNYRGVPKPDLHLEKNQLKFSSIADDLIGFMAHQGIEESHFLTWCFGIKPVIEIHRRQSSLIRSITAISPSYVPPSNKIGPFSTALLDLKARVDKDPSCLQRASRLIGGVGAVPAPNYFEELLAEPDNATSLELIETLENESSLSNLAFSLLGTPNVIANYLEIYEQFLRAPFLDEIPHVQCPFTAISGSLDGITKLTSQDLSDLSVMPRFEHVEILGASHFLLLEFPRKIAEIVEKNIFLDARQS